MLLKDTLGKFRELNCRHDNDGSVVSGMARIGNETCDRVFAVPRMVLLDIIGVAGNCKLASLIFDSWGQEDTFLVESSFVLDDVPIRSMVSLRRGKGGRVKSLSLS